MSKMSAYDFVPVPKMVGGISAATSGDEMLARLKRFVLDVQEKRVMISKIEVRSFVEPQTIVNTELTITFTELREADDAIR